ncbi:hypothetical protein IFM89_029154 [Coptis chinensis]|uniref:Sialate O-acetylesterase domain-containing protein n=1 Tax=Coptis chinensis TaxID=261450 RepID=A0A835IQY3_9MAGN|nr:hypothetical protein IFM89_029154 [Coptis chinensis]
MLVFLSFTLLYSGLVSSADYGPKNIFLLAGQSNMAGRGGVSGNKWDGKVPPACQPNPSILRLNAGLQWEEAHDPLHIDIDVGKACGVGPGMPFANKILSRIGLVGLVPCAIGGTKIREWTRGTGHYNDLVARANASLKEGGLIQALLWYQGESDTVKREDAYSYKGKMEKFIQDLRADLHSLSLPVIQVALASGEGPFVEVVREAQRGINLPNVTYVNAKGLNLKEDNLHLTTTSQVRLGQMLGHSFLNKL